MAAMDRCNRLVFPVSRKLKQISYLAFFLFVSMSGRNSQAQISGVTMRSPPMTHALIDAGELALGIGLSYSKIENPFYQIADIAPTSVVSLEETGFLALGITDNIALGGSTTQTQMQIKGSRTISGQTESIDDTILSFRYYYYIIPTLYRWKENRLALIWGKGKAVYLENTSLGIPQSQHDIGTTGLVSEIFLADFFSIIPWTLWPYTLFEIIPPKLNSFQTPDYGFDGVIHFGGVKLTLTMIFLALDTTNELTDESAAENKDNTRSKEATQESYAISLSFTF